MDEKILKKNIKTRNQVHVFSLESVYFTHEINGIGFIHTSSSSHSNAEFYYTVGLAATRLLPSVGGVGQELLLSITPSVLPSDSVSTLIVVTE